MLYEVSANPDFDWTKVTRGRDPREQLRIGSGTGKALELALSGRSSITNAIMRM